MFSPIVADHLLDGLGDGTAAAGKFGGAQGIEIAFGLQRGLRDGADHVLEV